MRYVVHVENHKPRIIETAEPNYADSITDAAISGLLVGDSVVVNRVRTLPVPEPSDTYVGAREHASRETFHLQYEPLHGDRNGVEL